MFDFNDLNSPISFSGGGGGEGGGSGGRNAGPPSGFHNSRDRPSYSEAVDYNGNGTARDEVALGLGIAAGVATGVSTGWSGVGSVAAAATIGASVAGYEPDR